MRNNFFSKIDKYSSYLVVILVVALCIIAFFRIILLISNFIDFLSYHLSYVIGVVILIGLTFLHFNFQNRKVSRRIIFDALNIKLRIILTLGGIAFIIFLVSNTPYKSYSDGRYCCTVDVSLNNSSKSYTLDVEVEEGYIVKILWGNGGWIDQSHFDIKKAEISKNGIASFFDDKGRDIVVYLNKKGNCN